MSEAALPALPEQPADSRAWQLWGLLKGELLYLCWALMDVAIAAPILLTVMRWGRFWPASLVTLWLLLLILLPFNLVRALSAFQVSPRAQRRVVLVALLITQLLAWRGLLYAPRPLTDTAWLGEFFGRIGESGDPQWARDLTVFLFVLLAWWRGLRLAQLTPDIYRVGFRLRAGGLLLAPIAFFLHVQGGTWSVTPYILLYFLAGLTAVALVRAEQIERDRSGFAASLSPGWVAAVFAAALLVTAVAGLLAAVLGGDPAAALSGWLAPLWRAVTALATVSISTLIYLLTPALNLLTSLFGWFAAALGGLFSRLGVRFGLEAPPGTDGLLPFDIPVPEEAAALLVLPDPVNRTLILLGMLAVAALLAFLLTRAFRLVSPASRAGRGGVADFDPAERPGLGERLLDRLGLWRRWRAAASVRNIYANMCLAAAAVGYPRLDAQTPYEFLATLAQVWPANTADSRLITDAFVRVRYGQAPETAAELDQIKEAWARLSATPPAVGADSPRVSSVADV